jgi:3-oxoacyl-[acyl-carrier protein] reductase
MIDLSGRVGLVTGASRGIGFAIARRLAQAGAQVVVTARRIDDDVIRQLNAEATAPVMSIEGSIEEPEFTQRLVKEVFSKYKRLDILVNNAGIMRPSMIGMISDADIIQTLQINLASVIRLMQSSARLMTRSGGSIINLSSIVGVGGTSGQLVYAASKAGVIGATLSAAKELASKQVRVNAIAPGFIATKMTEDLGAAVQADTLARIGLGRAGQPEEVADVALFLASDLSRYVTGQVIGVDGGMVQ